MIKSFRDSGSGFISYKKMNHNNYRVTHLLADWVGLTLFLDVPRLVVRYCSYLLPKQAGGTPQIKVY